ncbi:hypothetical protein ACFFMN_35795 [Planobispora siamensis]|uniref:Uncharacterized protein n=1 Tax=Planobispora siamensis TaxID=936338 RepID=A0A8J3SIZ2_9ACTN|nr:hypothetical protein [Planobispora siamensis]GIH95167.1 hypothetical protein Psi01_57970 [Planobispora siamensis]
MSVTREFAYVSSSRPPDSECVWYRSVDEAYDLIRTGSRGSFRYHVFDVRTGRHLREFTSWDEGHAWIEDRSGGRRQAAAGSQD